MFRVQQHTTSKGDALQLKAAVGCWRLSGRNRE